MCGVPFDGLPTHESCLVSHRRNIKKKKLWDLSDEIFTSEKYKCEVYGNTEEISIKDKTSNRIYTMNAI